LAFLPAARIPRTHVGRRGVSNRNRWHSSTPIPVTWHGIIYDIHVCGTWGRVGPSEKWVHNMPVAFCAVASLNVNILSVLCYNCRPKKRKIGLCVACTVRVWETNGISSLRSSYVQRFLSSAVSAPLMEVEMWIFGSGLAYCYLQNTDLVQVFRCALFREIWHTEPVCVPPCVNLELDIAFLSCIFLRLLSPERWGCASQIYNRLSNGFLDIECF